MNRKTVLIKDIISENGVIRLIEVHTTPLGFGYVIGNDKIRIGVVEMYGTMEI